MKSFSLFSKLLFAFGLIAFVCVFNRASWADDQERKNAYAKWELSFLDARRAFEQKDYRAAEAAVRAAVDSRNGSDRASPPKNNEQFLAAAGYCIAHTNLQEGRIKETIASLGDVLRLEAFGENSHVAKDLSALAKLNVHLSIAALELKLGQVSNAKADLEKSNDILTLLVNFFEEGKKEKHALSIKRVGALFHAVNTIYMMKVGQPAVLEADQAVTFSAVLRSTSNDVVVSPLAHIHASLYHSFKGEFAYARELLNHPTVKSLSNDGGLGVILQVHLASMSLAEHDYSRAKAHFEKAQHVADKAGAIKANFTKVISALARTPESTEWAASLNPQSTSYLISISPRIRSRCDIETVSGEVKVNSGVNLTVSINMN